MSAAIMLTRTINMMDMLSRPGHTKGASTAQAGVDTEATLDNGAFNRASGTQFWCNDRQGRNGEAIAGLRSLCVFVNVSCGNGNFLLVVSPEIKQGSMRSSLTHLVVSL